MSEQNNNNSKKSTGVGFDPAKIVSKIIELAPAVNAVTMIANHNNPKKDFNMDDEQKQVATSMVVNTVSSLLGSLIGKIIK